MPAWRLRHAPALRNIVGGIWRRRSPALESVTIPEAENRLGQLIRNDLISAFRPAGTGEPDRYTLVINSRSREENAVEEEDSHIARRTVRVNAAFISEATFLRARPSISGRLSQSSPMTAPARALPICRPETNAMERAAKVVSTDIRTRVAAYFATQ